MGKRWLIVSHERSGTEWLIASIIKNLFPSMYKSHAMRQPAWDVDEDRFYDSAVMREFLFERDSTRYNGDNHKIPFKSHHAFDFFEPLWDQVIEECNVLYIMRDGRDVMTSAWHHGWDYQGFMPRAFNVQQFIALQPTEPMGRYHGDYKVSNMAERWSRHIQSWSERDGVLYLSYEQLSQRYEETIRIIAKYAGEPIPVEIETVDLTGVNPWEGKTGNWVHYIEPSALNLFNKSGKIGMEIVGKHINGWRNLRS